MWGKKKRVRARAHMISSTQKKFSIEAWRWGERNGRAYQSKLVLWCLRGRKTFFLPAEHTHITASGSLCLLQVRQLGGAPQESCLIVNAPQESWWLFQIAVISFTAVGRKKKTKNKKQKQHQKHNTWIVFWRASIFVFWLRWKCCQQSQFL